MRGRLAELAGSLVRRQECQRQLALKILGSDPGLVRAAPREPVSIAVCAVDGGLLAARMHGADIVLSRAVAVRFDYRASRPAGFGYHPGKNPPFDIDTDSSLDEGESLAFRSLVRLRSELRCALEAHGKWGAGALLLDGSLLPLPSDRPGGGSALGGLYSDVIGLYSRLFAQCEGPGTLLCGVVKDSRSRRLSRSLGADLPDTVLCHHLLQAGEMTRPIPFSDAGRGADEASALASRVSVLYIRPSESALPLRVEVLGGRAESAASLVLGLSSISENFAYPAPLVEADMRATMDPAEIEAVEYALSSLSGMRSLRRNSRPFR